MPSDEVIWAVVLLNTHKLAIDLVHDSVINVQVIVNSGNRVQKVAGVGQTMATQRP